MSQTRKKIKGQVTIDLERYSVSKKKMDFDNLVSTAKCIFDGIVMAEIIEDDSPEIIVHMTVKQTKVGKQKDQKTVIIITSYGEKI